MDLRRRFLPLLVLVMSATLASCGTQPTRAPAPVENVYEQRAEAALERGNLQEAARLLGDAAATTDAPEEAARLRFRAAELWLDLGYPSPARFQLSRLPDALPEALRWRRQLIEARLHLAQDDPERALALLEETPVPTRLVPEWLKARAEALAAAGRPMEAARALSQWLASGPPAAEAEAGETTLWSLLGQIPMETLRASMPPPPDEFGGWLELAFLVRDLRLQPAELTRAVEAWRQRYPGHPAAERIAPEMLARYRDGLRHPEHVALLLPLSGPLSGAAEAVHEGFMAAYYAAEGEKPQVRVYDVGTDGRHALTAYDDAVAAGAEFVVGPLTKESLVMLAGQGELPVPVLALNTLPDGHVGPDNLYQFGLAPEDEAWAAADFAISHALERAVVLVPSGEWGQRVAQAFERAFAEQGGQVLESAAYNPSVSDFSDPIRAVLNLDASERRYRELRGVLRRSIHFEPYRRQDVEFVFLAAYPREGRLIRPQLDFFRSIDLPVVATSHIYGGQQDPADQDLRGVMFMETPWVLGAGAPDDALSRQRLESLGLQGGATRLHALGIDAYRLIPYVGAMRGYPGESLDGKTGFLTVGADGRVVRHLLPGRFVKGRVEPLPQNRAFGERPENVAEPGPER